MSLFVLDTDTLSLHQRGHPRVCQRVANQSPVDVMMTVISVQEQFDGWRAVLNRAKTRAQLADAYQFFNDIVLPSLQQFDVLACPEPAILRFEQLLALKLNIGRMDLRIAAIVLENNAIVVTRNHRDFSRVPGLTLEDWSV